MLLVASALLGRVLLLANLPASSLQPASIQFVGESSPPASELTLWYREPAAERSHVRRCRG